MVSHLQEENDTLWAKVKATGQAMNDTHASSRSRASQDQAGRFIYQIFALQVTVPAVL